MKIAMIGQKGLPAHYGGVERHVEELSERLVLHGHEVTVYSRQWYTKGADGEIKGVKIKHLPSIHTKHLDTISHVFLATLDALRQKFDVIHYHGIGPSLLSWLPRIFARQTKVITTFHSIDRYDQKWNALAKMILRLAEWCACKIPHKTITVSRGLEKYCLNEFYQPTHYIPNGISLYNKSENQNKIADFGLTTGEYFIMVSRLIPTKGAHVLISAFNQLKKQHADNPLVQKMKLAIVGGAVYTNAYVRDLHQLAALNNDIIFTDFQSGETLHALYSQAMALIHPSFNEGLPLAVLEGMSHGLPVLLSAIAEHRELLDDNRFIFRENDSEELLEKMWQFINLNAAEKKQAGDKNRLLIENSYEWDKILPQILAVYQNQNPPLSPMISSLPS